MQAAFHRGDLRLIKRITALLLLADGLPAATAAERLGVGRSTIYCWLHTFVVERWASLRYRTSPDRLAILTASQKQRLDEASFAQWGSLGYTWAPIGQQPLVKTCGKRKGYKVFGLIDSFSRRLLYGGQRARFTAERYCEFLVSVLSRVSGPIMLIQDGARYHTAAKTQAFLVPLPDVDPALPPRAPIPMEHRSAV